MTVGDKLFALVQAGLPTRPVNVLPAPVGKVHQVRLLYFNDARAREIEAGIVFGNHGIVCGAVPQLGGRTDSTGNNRIRVDETLIACPNFGLGQTGKNG